MDDDSANPDVPIVMLTGHTETERVITARDAGVNLFLAKPVSVKALSDRILSLIDPFTEERIFTFAVEVAKLRGADLKAALDVGHSKKAGPEPSQLKGLREAFEEPRETFAALMTAIERGYIDLPSVERS